MKALLLAAGFGTRFRPYTESLPKPAIPFLGVPLFCYTKTALEQLGATDFLMNLHYLPEKMKKTAEKHGIHQFSFESPEILGSGGALWGAKDLLQSESSFFLSNADELIFWKDAPNLLGAHKKTDAFASLLCMEHPEAGRKYGGVWVDEENQVMGFGKEAPATKLKALHYLGVQVIDKKVFDYVEEGETNIFYDIYVDAISKGEKIYAHKVDCQWFETGNWEDYFTAHKDCFSDCEKMGYLMKETILRERGREFWLSLCKQSSKKQFFHPSLKLPESLKARGHVFVDQAVSLDHMQSLENAILYGPSSDHKIKDQMILPNVIL